MNCLRFHPAVWILFVFRSATLVYITLEEWPPLRFTSKRFFFFTTSFVTSIQAGMNSDEEENKQRRSAEEGGQEDGEEEVGLYILYQPRPNGIYSCLCYSYCC